MEAALIYLGIKAAEKVSTSSKRRLDELVEEEEEAIEEDDISNMT